MAGRGGKRKIDDAKGDIQAAAGLLCHKLAHAGDLECRAS